MDETPGTSPRAHIQATSAAAPGRSARNRDPVKPPSAILTLTTHCGPQTIEAAPAGPTTASPAISTRSRVAVPPARRPRRSGRHGEVGPPRFGALVSGRAGRTRCRGDLAAEFLVAPWGRGPGRWRWTPVRAAPCPDAWALEPHAHSRDAETAAFRAAVPFELYPQRRNGAVQVQTHRAREGWSSWEKF